MTKLLNPSQRERDKAFIERTRLGRSGMLVTLLSLLTILLFRGAGYWLSELATVRFWGDQSAAHYLQIFTCQFFFVTVWYGFGLLAVSAFILRRPFSTLICAGTRFRPGLALAGAALGALMCVACLMLAIFDTGIDWHDPRGAPELGTPSQILNCFYVMALLLPIRAAEEEIQFRGLLTQQLGDALRHPFWLSLVVGVIFALAHQTLEPLWFLDLAAFSMALSAFRIATGGLSFSIGYHAAYNVALAAVLSFFDYRLDAFAHSTWASVGMAALNIALGISALRFARHPTLQLASGGRR